MNFIGSSLDIGDDYTSFSIVITAQIIMIMLIIIIIIIIIMVMLITVQMTMLIIAIMTNKYHFMSVSELFRVKGWGEKGEYSIEQKNFMTLLSQDRLKMHNREIKL